MIIGTYKNKLVLSNFSSNISIQGNEINQERSYIVISIANFPCDNKLIPKVCYQTSKTTWTKKN